MTSRACKLSGADTRDLARAWAYLSPDPASPRSARAIRVLAPLCLPRAETERSQTNRNAQVSTLVDE